MYSEQTCTVCDLCYKLLVTEQELLEIQKTIALCMNIQVPSEEEIKKKNPSSDAQNRFYKKIDRCDQWRALFYFTRIYNIELDKLPFDTNITYKLYIKLFEQKIGIPIFTKNSKVITGDEVELNLAKMFYFFSDKNSNVKQILKTEVVDFRIVINDDWHNPLAHCETTCFASFDLENKNVRIKTTLNFFSPEIKLFKCQVYIGLTVDHNIISNNIPLYSFKLLNTIYLTDEDYFSHHELPDDWFELFLPSDAEINEEDNYDFESSIDKLTKDDAFRNINNKKKKRRVKNEKEDDVLYDPYDVLVQLQQKKNMINKIKSIPILHDKFATRGKSAKYSRPNTAFQKSLSKITSQNYPNPRLHKQDSVNDNFSNNEEAEVFRKESILNMDHENLEKLLNTMDKKMSNFNL